MTGRLTTFSVVPLLTTREQQRHENIICEFVIKFKIKFYL